MSFEGPLKGIESIHNFDSGEIDRPQSAPKAWDETAIRHVVAALDRAERNRCSCRILPTPYAKKCNDEKGSSVK